MAHLEAWKKSFKTDVSNRHPGRHKRWIVSNKKGDEDETPIDATQQTVESAQSEINDIRKRDAPIPKSKTKVDSKRRKNPIFV